jgi:hypothetical protein
MTWLALAWALQHADAQESRAQSVWGTWTTSGRLVDKRDIHVGLRPAVEIDPEGGINWGVGLTLQISALSAP